MALFEISAAVAVGVVIFYLYRKYFAQQVFVKEGIPGPKPHWLIGNLAAFADEDKRHLVLPNWTKKYGKIYGIYEGSRPVIVSSDVDFVQQVFVKQFQTFQHRKEMPKQATADGNAILTNSMIMAKGDHWKRLRTIVNPTFSSGKLKSLMPLMHKVQTDFMQLIECKATSGEAFNIFECFKLLTLDTISEAAFGVELNSAQDSIRKKKASHPLAKAIDDLMAFLFRLPATVQIAMFLPELEEALHRFELMKTFVIAKFSPPKVTLLQLVTDVIKARKGDTQQKLKRQDLLQMLLDSTSETASDRALTIDEVSGQSVLFFIGGYETSSNVLAFTSFLLANHPQVQEKLVAEIEQSKMGEAIDYETVTTLKYLDCVVNESLRLFPVALLGIARSAVEDAVVNGIRVPKGYSVMVDIWSIHRDEEQWGPVDVEQFHPERFTDDYPTTQTRSEAAFMPFGLGPRICIGMRFALLEIKMALVNLLKRYHIEKTERTGDALKLLASFTMTPADGVYVRLAKRHP